MCRWSSTHAKNPTSSSSWIDGEDYVDALKVYRRLEPGSIPHFIELQIQPEMHKSLNNLSKEMQRKLRKSEYDFTKVEWSSAHNVTLQLRSSNDTVVAVADRNLNLLDL